MSELTVSEQAQADFRREERAAHAMQSGVAYEMVVDPEAAATSPKQLRVGVNAALVGLGALEDLLVDKGIITIEEVAKAHADGMKREQERYEARLGVQLG